jgi:hypothetical protein
MAGGITHATTTSTQQRVIVRVIVHLLRSPELATDLSETGLPLADLYVSHLCNIEHMR